MGQSVNQGPTLSRAAQPDFQGVLLDTRTILQSRLDIENKERCNLFPWNGQFSPQLVEQLLRTFSGAGGLVLDPFLGSGTVLHEAGRLGLPAFGAEINPAAYKLSQIYSLINLPSAKRRRILERAETIVDDLTPDVAPLFATPRPRDDRSLPEVLRRAGTAPIPS